MFTNTNIALDTLPTSADARQIAPSPVFPRIVLGQALAFWVAILIAAVILPWFVMDLPAAPRTVLLVVTTLLACWFTWLAYRSAAVVRYAVREHDVILWRGVFWKKETVQPINRVQHVERVQGPLDKRFGLAKLKLFSAGTGHFTFEIPGLEERTAVRMQQFILDRKQATSTEVPQETNEDTRPATADD